MASGDGNGWVVCRFGHRHWGRFGAAGLVLVRAAASDHPDHPADDAGGGGLQVLMQLRAPWTHEGGRWGVPGGARDSHETIPEAAVREAHEEAGIDPALVRVAQVTEGTNHGNWSYTYVVAVAEPGLVVGPHNEESDELAWVGVDAVRDLPLHSGFAGSWPDLRPLIENTLEVS